MSQYDDLVSQLRQEGQVQDDCRCPDGPLMRDAANTIRVLEAANATLREQLAQERTICGDTICGDCRLPETSACHCAEHLRICEEQQRAEAAETSASHRLSLINELRDSLDAAEAKLAEREGDVIGGLTYRGNTVSYMYDKATCYGDQSLAAFKALRKLGFDDSECKNNTELFAALERFVIEREGDGEKLHQIESWANAYPEDIFTSPTEEELANVTEQIGKSMMTRLHGSWGNHILAGVRRILNSARQAEDGGGEKD